jgi:hypothetical protein
VVVTGAAQTLGLAGVEEIDRGAPRLGEAGALAGAGGGADDPRRSVSGCVCGAGDSGAGFPFGHDAPRVGMHPRQRRPEVPRDRVEIPDYVAGSGDVVGKGRFPGAGRAGEDDYPH